MELSTITIKGRKVSVIFTGSTYYFYNEYFGYLAIAERDAETERANRATAFFTVYVGNHHTTGGTLSDSAILPAVRRFIKRAENQFITKKVGFETVLKDLANVFVNMSYSFR